MPGASETTICCQISWGILVCAYIQLRSGDKALQRTNCCLGGGGGGEGGGGGGVCG